KGEPLCSRLLLGRPHAASEEHPANHALTARRETVFSKVEHRPYPALSQLANSSHSLGCHAASTRETRYLPEFAGGNAGIIAEKAGEMRGIGKSEACAELADGNLAMQDGVPRPFHAHDVEIDLGRQADRRLEQPEEMRARKTNLFRQRIDAGFAAGIGTDIFRRAPDP